MASGTRPKPSGFRLIRGGLASQVWLRGVRVVASPPGHRPFPVGAMVAEEDTYLVLSADADLLSPAGHPIRVMTAALHAIPKAPGSVLTQRGEPLRFLAVIHDLNLEPSWKEAWIAQALHKVLAEAGRRRIPAIGLPLLGTIHGNLPRHRFLTLLRQAVEDCDVLTLERLWLIVPEGTAEEVIHSLESR